MRALRIAQGWYGSEVGCVDLTLTEAGLAPRTWHYRVAAVFAAGDADNPGGESLASDPFTIRVLAFPGKQLAVTLIWRAPVDPLGTPLIDPESGISSGGGSTDVKLAPGDVISFRFNYTPVPDKIVHGLQGYLPEYVPPNTEVVGVRYIDATGLTLVPDYPGIAVDSCGRPCSGFNSVPSSSGNRNLDDGSISQLYADTGVFFSTDARARFNPGNAFISFANGVLMNPAPTSIGSVSGILGTSAPFFAHDAWDGTTSRCARSA